MRISGKSRGLLSAALLLIVYFLPASAASRADAPGSSVVYCVFPRIFSPEGNFAGVTRQLPRLKALGITIVWLMPVTPMGEPFQGHPAFDSPYCVHDYYGINPAYGTSADLKALVAEAHRLGLKVILDEVLNHTAWDNALIRTHPEFYEHSDGNNKNPNSIVKAFTYNDVAQLNYVDHDLWRYMTGMLSYWITTYGLDGFRMDTASNPDGPTRKIPAAFWRDAGESLRRQKPGLVLLGECETPDMAPNPFDIDYGWWLQDSLKAAANGGDAAQVGAVWQHQHDAFPKGMLHLSLQDDWDYPRDIAVFGGASGALAVAAFYETIDGVPLIYNGMEIGNAAEGVNPRRRIDWEKGNPVFAEFYRQMLTLRRENPALQQGKLTFLVNSAPHSVLTYERSEGGKRFVVEINFSDAVQVGTVTGVGTGWREVTPAAVRRKVGHELPPRFELGAKGVAVFEISR